MFMSACDYNQEKPEMVEFQVLNDVFYPDLHEVARYEVLGVKEIMVGYIDEKIE